MFELMAKKIIMLLCSKFLLNLTYEHRLFCLFVLLLYIPSQQLWSWRDGIKTRIVFNTRNLFIGLWTSEISPREPSFWRTEIKDSCQQAKKTK